MRCIGTCSGPKTGARGGGGGALSSSGPVQRCTLLGLQARYEKGAIAACNGKQPETNIIHYHLPVWTASPFVSPSGSLLDLDSPT